MAAIFALLLAVENALHTRKLLAPCGLFLGTCAAGYAAGVVLGSLNNGYSASRENYGVFSFNLNALFNPSSKGGYTWSRILPARPQLYGQYDGFNYLGFGMLALLGVLCAAAVVLAVRSKAGRAALAGLLRRNLVLILGMAFMTLFAITNVVCFDDVELLNIPLPEGLVKLFRASGRMFYPVYYVLMTACIVGLARLLRRVGKAALYPAVLVLVAAVQLFDLSAMIAEKHTAMAETAAKPQPYPQELVDCRDNYGTLMLADDIIHARNVICAAWHPGMITNGYDVNTYTGAWNVTIDWTAQTSAAVDSGTLDPDTLYVTGDADRFASWQAQYGDKADYITWDIAATGIYDRRDEYYFMAPKQ